MKTLVALVFPFDVSLRFLRLHPPFPVFYEWTGLHFVLFAPARQKEPANDCICCLFCYRSRRSRVFRDYYLFYFDQDESMFHAHFLSARSQMRR